MSFKPLTKDRLLGTYYIEKYDPADEEDSSKKILHYDDVRSAVEGLKSAYVQDIVDEEKNCSSCGIYTQQHYWGRNGDSVCRDCWIDKWFPVFLQSHLNDSTYSSEELRPSGSSMTEPANLDAVAIDLPCNPSQRVETVTSHSHSLFPDQEVRDLNNPLEKGGGSEQTSTLTPISARDFSTLTKQMGFSFYVDGNGKLLISLSQPSIPKTETQAKNDSLLSEGVMQHGIPAGEFKTESTSANGKDNTPKHAPGNGDCICKHGSGAITKTFVEQNGLCSCECHKEVRS